MGAVRRAIPSILSSLIFFLSLFLPTYSSKSPVPVSSITSFSLLCALYFAFFFELLLGSSECNDRCAYL